MSLIIKLFMCQPGTEGKYNRPAVDEPMAVVNTWAEMAEEVDKIDVHSLADIVFEFGDEVVRFQAYGLDRGWASLKPGELAFVGEQRSLTWVATVGDWRHGPYEAAWEDELPEIAPGTNEAGWDEDPIWHAQMPSREAGGIKTWFELLALANRCAEYTSTPATT